MTSEKSDKPWAVRGNCVGVDPEVMFPVDGVGVAIAQLICKDCPVQHECLEYALENRIEHGVWGGKSERERRRIKRLRRRGHAR